jgi:inhibitor of Bruton tyrosine kinase
MYRVLLVQRSDIDMYMKDIEGYTAFDLYNSTVEGTNPPKTFDGKPSAGLYTWGSNRNATLGLGDDGDRSLPEQIIIRRDGETQTTSVCERLKPLSIIGIFMSKLHTTIITEEPRNNLRSCGFASDGRLGPAATSSHAQFSLINPQRSLSHAIVAVALGQDHTLAVTANGDVLSWGLNRFGQLGYVIEGNNRTLETQVQSSARKITGALRNQVVLGVACCKSASACWTAKHLFTWGSNAGQLGLHLTAIDTDCSWLVRLRESISASSTTTSSSVCHRTGSCRRDDRILHACSFGKQGCHMCS